MSAVGKTQQNDYNMVVADNIRAELSRERWSGRKAATALGVTPNWIHRRLSGETPLDPNDIVMFANFLRVDISDLFRAKKNGPTSEEAGPQVLPHLDSNQEPIGSPLAPVTSISTHRNSRETPVEHAHLAPVTNLHATAS